LFFDFVLFILFVCLFYLWGRCFPVYKKIKESIANGDIGEVHMVRASFNVPLQYSTLPPLSSSSSSVAGMLHDIGLYTIQFVLFVYGEMPTSITAVGDVLDNGKSSIR
jgi:predicted dehydrogenase